MTQPFQKIRPANRGLRQGQTRLESNLYILPLNKLTATRFTNYLQQIQTRALPLHIPADDLLTIRLLPTLLTYRLTTQIKQFNL
ncbi:hypothetical protein GCM10027341_56730 [Spirosoma knui]